MSGRQAYIPVVALYQIKSAISKLVRIGARSEFDVSRVCLEFYGSCLFLFSRSQGCSSVPSVLEEEAKHTRSTTKANLFRCSKRLEPHLKNPIKRLSLNLSAYWLTHSNSLAPWLNSSRTSCDKICTLDRGYSIVQTKLTSSDNRHWKVLIYLIVINSRQVVYW